jgi:nitroreductase
MERDPHFQSAGDDPDPAPRPSETATSSEANYILPSGEYVLRALETRRSVGSGFLAEPGPNEEELRRMLTIATRVPDHGKLEPWRLLVFQGDARLQAGERLAAIYRQEHHFMGAERLEKLTGAMSRVFSYAPLVVLVISSPALLAKIPVREQEASAAAVCMNMLHAAHAYGFGADWVTGWAADSEGAAAFYGLDRHERVIGIIHIGTFSERPNDRPRPDLDRIVRFWAPDGGAD